MRVRTSGRRLAWLAGLVIAAGVVVGGVALGSHHPGRAASAVEPRPVRIALVYADPQSTASCYDSGKIVDARADGSDAATRVAYLAGGGGCIPDRIEIRSLETGRIGLSRDGKTVLAGIGCGEVMSPFGVVESIPFRDGTPHVLARGPCRATSNA